LGANGTFAAGINDAGEIVGWYTDNAGRYHGFLEDGGVVTTIDNPLGTNGTVVQGINDVGQIVGWYTDSSGNNHGFVASLNGNSTAEAQNLVGTSGNDVLVGGSAADTLTGSAGNDKLTGGGGSDRFDYNNIADGTDVITDFTRGAGGDKLDIRDVLVGYNAGTPGAFIGLQEAGGSTTVLVNTDGAGTDFVPLATLQGQTGLLLNDLLANNNLIVSCRRSPGRGSPAAARRGCSRRVGEFELRADPREWNANLAVLVLLHQAESGKRLHVAVHRLYIAAQIPCQSPEPARPRALQAREHCPARGRDRAEKRLGRLEAEFLALVAPALPRPDEALAHVLARAPLVSLDSDGHRSLHRFLACVTSVQKSSSSRSTDTNPYGSSRDSIWR
jgi:probable HAF family extracellular repeat protein